MAIPTSQAMTRYAPNLVKRVRTTIPATISIMPTICMKVAGETGTTLVASGLKYICQSASLLKYLSSPAMMGPIPKPSRKAHHAVLDLSMKAAIFPLHRNEWAGRIWLQDYWPVTDWPVAGLFSGGRGEV